MKSVSEICGHGLHLEAEVRAVSKKTYARGHSLLDIYGLGCAVLTYVYSFIASIMFISGIITPIFAVGTE
jgi:hypothetical protein